MIYQLKNGPLDGDELDIQEMPIGSIYRFPMPREIVFEPLENPYEPPSIPEARYRVTDIGEMTFDHYKG